VSNYERAAKRGWQVEIWSWSDQLSHLLCNIAAKYPANIKIFILDEWYFSIVFIKGGAYFVNDINYTVNTRSCSGLKLTDSAFEDAITPALRP
jgi:hypothetical protein